MNDSLKRRAELETRKRELEKELDLIKTEIQSLNNEIKADFIENETQKITQNGYTFYISEQIWASCTDVKRAKKYFFMDGREDLVKESINTQSLSAYIREFNKDGNEVYPQPIKEAIDLGLIKVSKNTDIRLRSA